ncbi:MAG: formylmethanofuran dehydrogenase subunit C [Gammaproteobacteria bacterium]|nr:formylmethanofuran dehydrogenase subunit C [Gammaproteobacteria bacterium]
MKPLILTLRRNDHGRIDVSPLTPDKLHGMNRDAVAAIRLQCGRRRVRVDTLFEITGRGARRVEIRRSTDQLFRIGFRMRSGTLEVRGHAGDNLGERMEGGEIRVRGDAGEWVGASMGGGLIDVSGCVGHRIGAALPGQLTGMKDGLILIAGDAGDRAGERMRAGTIVVLGNSGPWLAHRMAAGTIIVMGRSGAHAGIGMKRGTILMGRKPLLPPVGFRAAGTLKMEFLRLLFKQLGGTRTSMAMFRGFGPEAIRLAGDLTAGGKGEILILLNARAGAAT